MYLGYKDYKVLLALQQTPLANISQLARDLDLSYYETKKSLQNLEKNEVIKGYSATIEPELMKLKKRAYLYKVTNFANLNELEKLLDAHNYTIYRTRYTSGESRGLYAEFAFPEKVEAYQEDLHNQLVEKEKIDLVHRFNGEIEKTDTNVDLKKIDQETLNWQFSMENWKKEETKNQKKRGKNNNNKKEDEPETPDKIIETDLWLLRALSINPRKPNKELAKIIEDERKKMHLKPLNKDLSTISRRLKHVKDNYIGDCQVLINKALFNLDSQLIYEVEIKKEKTREVKEKLVCNPIPFKSNFIETRRGFRWYLYRCPPEVSSAINNYLWELEPKKMRKIDLFLPRGLYYFYPLNYDTEEYRWEDDESYFYQPIEKWIN